MLTGLLTEPGNKAMSVAIFGYGIQDRVWRTYVVDLDIVIQRNCEWSMNCVINSSFCLAPVIFPTGSVVFYEMIIMVRGK